ncbi:hypothetical protein D3C84_122040 [compost metagenome]
MPVERCSVLQAVDDRNRLVDAVAATQQVLQSLGRIPNADQAIGGQLVGLIHGPADTDARMVGHRFQAAIGRLLLDRCILAVTDHLAQLERTEPKHAQNARGYTAQPRAHDARDTRKGVIHRRTKLSDLGLTAHHVRVDGPQLTA